MIEELKPTEKRHVYDLLHDAGMDVSDWSNYRLPDRPAANPKYCYNWAFIQDDAVVLCLWLEHMKEDKRGIYQSLNYREINASANESTVRRRRAGEMDDAFQAAKNRELPIRVIIVDGPPLEEREEGVSPVQARSLDSKPWHIESYDDDGNCVIRRGKPPAPKGNQNSSFIARIAYNSQGWRQPSGDAPKLEAAGSFSAEQGFGHEEWLFRNEWVIDGWRYAFIEGLRKGRNSKLGKSLDVTLYTVRPDRRRQLVATVYGLEALTNEQARDALQAFREKGWLKIMQDEVRAVGGNLDVLMDPEAIVNVRYRIENLDLQGPESLLPESKWITDRHRYLLYAFDTAERETIERAFLGRSGSPEAPKARQLFRRGTKAVYFTPEHQKIQAKLVKELRKNYPKESILCEQDFVDVRVETQDEVIYYEIKTDLDVRTVIRQALGQLLEYAYHPSRAGRQPDRLVIVGRGALTDKNVEYLNCLIEKFKLPLSYLQMEL